MTANNPAGSTTATLIIEVLATDMAPAGLAYSTSAPVYAAGTTIAPDKPIISSLGGAPTNYSVSPDVSPIGLTLDPTSGVLSGTPAPCLRRPAPPLTMTYTVTASNSAGTVTAPLTITIYNSHQAVPNMAQAIDPLAAPGSSFQFLDTGMVVTDTYNPRCGAGGMDGRPGGQHCSQPEPETSGGVDERVQPRVSRSVSVL